MVMVCYTAIEPQSLLMVPKKVEIAVPLISSLELEMKDLFKRGSLAKDLGLSLIDEY